MVDLKQHGFSHIELPDDKELKEYLEVPKLNVLQRVLHKLITDGYKNYYDLREEFNELVNTKIYFGIWYHYYYGYKLRLLDLSNGQYHGELRNDKDETIYSSLNKDYNMILEELLGRYNYLTNSDLH